LILCISLKAQDSSKVIPFYSVKNYPDFSQIEKVENPFDYKNYAGEKDQTSPRLPNVTWHDWITNIPQDYVRFYDVALNTSIPVYLSIAASTAALMATDRETFDAQYKWYKSSHFLHEASNIFEQIGAGNGQLALTVVFVGFGLIDNDQRAIRTGSQIAQVTISSGAIVQVLKHLTGRESPVVSTTRTGEWKFFPSPLAYHKRIPYYDAYPSGHLTTMISMVEVISENYPEWKWVDPVGYSISGLMAVSMVNKGVHWYSDYPLAIYLGYEFGKIVAHPEKYKSNSDASVNKVSINISPYTNYTGTGLALLMRF
jgi:PAP2 superfamily